MSIRSRLNKLRHEVAQLAQQSADADLGPLRMGLLRTNSDGSTEIIDHGRVLPGYPQIYICPPDENTLGFDGPLEFD